MRVVALARRISGLACVLLAACDNPAETKSFTLTLAAEALTVGQSGTAVVGITLERSNFEGAVLLSAEGLPEGVTASFAPVSVTGSTSVLTVSATGTATPGTSTVTIVATGEGVAEQSETLDLTVSVTGSYSLDALEGTVTVAQGATLSSSVLVNRTGGYAGSVALSVSGAPAGLTVTLGEVSTTGRSVPVTVAASGVAAGSYTITVTGTTPGLANQQTTFTVSVIAPPATASLTMTFCSTSRPVWLAYRNEGAGWQVATASGNAFTFNATSRLGVAMAFLSQSGESKQVTIMNLLRSEAALHAGRDCGGSNTLSGTVAGLASGQMARIGMGAVTADPPPTGTSTAFTLSGVASRTLDLVATRGSESTSGEFTPDKMIIRRNLDPATAGSLGTLDFSAAEAFALQQQTLTLSNIAIGEALTVISTFWTATSTFGALQSVLPASGTVQYLGVPAAQQVAGDLHEMYLDAYQPSASVGRSMLSYFAAPGDRTETFGPQVLVPTVSTIATTPYLRLRGRLALQSEYTAAARFAVYQEPGGASDTRFVIMLTTAGFLGGAPPVWDITTPDFTGLAGFNAAWMPANGQVTAWQVVGYGGRADLIFDGAPVAGDLLRFSDRQGTVSANNLRVVSAGRLPRAQYFRR